MIFWEFKPFNRSMESFQKVMWWLSSNSEVPIWCLQKSNHWISEIQYCLSGMYHQSATPWVTFRSDQSGMNAEHSCSFRTYMGHLLHFKVPGSPRNTKLDFFNTLQHSRWAYSQVVTTNKKKWGSLTSFFQLLALLVGTVTGLLLQSW